MSDVAVWAIYIAAFLVVLAVAVREARFAQWRTKELKRRQDEWRDWGHWS